MNTETLHAVDMLYLQVFQQNLLAETRRARISLKQHHQQSATLASAKELPPNFKQNYRETSELLLPLINMLGKMLEVLESGDLSCQVAHLGDDHVETASLEGAERVIDLLDTAEQEILDALNMVGVCMTALPRSIIGWHDYGQFRVHVLLKSLPDRPCYEFEIPIDFYTHPFLIAEYLASKKQVNRQCSQWPHYLIDEVMPLGLYPLIDDLWVDMNIRGDGYASWRSRKSVIHGHF